jgi:ribonucleoside-diphosphate reductase beta chain
MGEQIAQECFDDKTEILTISGWKFFKDLNLNDLVAQYNLDTTAISFVNPQRFIERDCDDELIVFESNYTSIAVTQNHELINIHPVTKKYKKRPAKETKGGNYGYPKGGKFLSSVENRISTLTKLLVAIAADGSVRRFDRTELLTTNVQIQLTKDRKLNRLEDYLNELNISFTKTPRKHDSFCFSFTLPTNLSQDYLKSLNFIKPFLLSKTAAIELLNELVFWDGNQSNLFYSTNKSAADMVQILALVAEKTASVGINRTAEQALSTVLPQGKTALQTKTCYVVSISECKVRKYPSPKKIAYKGKVYCVTVPDGNIVTRRNGKIAVTGNCMHNQSYQYIIETVIPGDRRTAVYEFWRTDKVLADRCKFIAQLYQNYIDNPTSENYFVALLADYLLEGLYFYNGFLYFYNLASRMLMPGSADIFKMINRDELSHVRLYQKLIPEAMRLFPHSVDRIYEMFDTAVQHECLWTNHIVGNNILGITEGSTEQYTKYLANMRLGAIGLDPIYTGEKYAKSPYKHLERFSDTKKEGHTKANFFEASVTSYVMSSGVAGWDEI